MKIKNKLLLTLLVLLQSCYTYKSIDLQKTSFVKGKKYKIKINKKFAKGRIINLNDSIVNFKTNKRVVDYKISEIKAVKKRKFSVIKTVLAVPAVPVVAATVIVAIGGLDIGISASPKLDLK